MKSEMIELLDKNRNRNKQYQNIKTPKKLRLVPKQDLTREDMVC